MTMLHPRPLYFVLLLIFTGIHVPAMALSQQAPAHEPDISDMKLIPAGKFIMGSDRVDDRKVSKDYGNLKPWYLDEHPRHTVNLPAYYIEEHEVTNGQYLKYLQATSGSMPQYWFKNGYVIRQHTQQLEALDIDRLRHLATDIYHIDKNTLIMSREELIRDIDAILVYMDSLPVTRVTWQQASDYCQWAGFRLPTEAEWEKAARGPEGREFPWGNEWHDHMTNAGAETWDMYVAPVESYPTDKSSFGIYDLAGNVSEWVSDWYEAYPQSDYNSKDFGHTYKVVRGAGWSGGEGHYALQLFQRGAYRGNLDPARSYDDVGFRCAADVDAIQHARHQ